MNHEYIRNTSYNTRIYKFTGTRIKTALDYLVGIFIGFVAEQSRLKVSSAVLFRIIRIHTHTQRERESVIKFKLTIEWWSLMLHAMLSWNGTLLLNFKRDEFRMCAIFPVENCKSFNRTSIRYQNEKLK